MKSDFSAFGLDRPMVLSEDFILMVTTTPMRRIRRMKMTTRTMRRSRKAFIPCWNLKFK